jgi:hypothetical protein
MGFWLLCCQRFWQRLRMRLLRKKPPQTLMQTNPLQKNAQLDEEYRAVIRELDDILASSEV